MVSLPPLPMAGSFALMVAAAWPPALLLVLTLIWMGTVRLRRHWGGRWSASGPARLLPSQACLLPRCSTGGVASKQRQQPHLRRVVAQAAEPAKPSVPDRDIALRVANGTDGAVAGVTVDGLASGDVLLQRARCCLGEGLGDLLLPGGQALDLFRPLRAQGLQGGELLVAQRVARRRSEHVERHRVVMENYLVHEHKSIHDSSEDWVDIVVSAKQEPAALAEADEQTVRVDFQEEHFRLTIRGRCADHLFYKRIFGHGAARRDLLPVRWTLCPARCSFSVTPFKCVEMTLRPYPENWLNIGTRVRVEKLKEVPELNGLEGTVDGYFEAEGKFKPARYCVKLDNGRGLKKFKRRNLHELKKASDQAVAAAGLGGCDQDDFA
mmetsp:Transcript_88644/g.251269  ORF Transcript_88644/g.251269 Transcript_88644/m.251269 type:complete len:380 (+) Transcript_88644:46-1185(+)